MKAIDKIKKLLALSKSPNENEAAAALSKAMEIAAAKGIDIKDAEAARENEEIGRRQAEKARMRVPYWQRHLGSSLAEIFGCIMIDRITRKIFSSSKQIELQFVGFPSDLEIVEYVYAYLKRQVIRIANEHMKTKNFRKRARMEQYKADYLRGIVAGVVCNAKTFYRRDHGTEAGLVPHRVAMIKRHLMDAGTTEVDIKSRTNRHDALMAGYGDSKKIGINHGVNGAKSGDSPRQIQGGEGQ